MSTLTTNKNFLSPNGFRLTIGAAEFQNLEYFCTYAPLPPISADGIALQWRGKQTAVTGDQLASYILKKVKSEFLISNSLSAFGTKNTLLLKVHV